MKSFTTRMCSFMEIGLSFDCGSRVEVTVEWALVFKHITLILTSDIKSRTQGESVTSFINSKYLREWRLRATGG